MARVVEIDHAEFERWLAGRPAVIREMAAKRPPGVLYRMKSTGQRVTIYSYNENGTMTVEVLGRYNLVSHERRVFGIALADLEECDLPSPRDLVGAMLTAEEVEAALAGVEGADNRLEAIHLAASRKVEGQAAKVLTMLQGGKR